MDGAHGEGCELLRGAMHDRQSPMEVVYARNEAPVYLSIRCFIMTNQISIRCEKHQRLVYGVYTRVYTPPNTPLPVSKDVSWWRKVRESDNSIKRSWDG